MKHDELRSVAHNIADSLASGIGLMIGVYDMNIFGEAEKTPKGFIAVDFLNGKTINSEVSPSLTKAIQLYSESLPDLCEKHKVSIADFKKLTAKYSSKKHDRYVIIEVEDKNGRISVNEYVGSPLKHIKITDSQGRIRTKRGSKKSE